VDVALLDSVAALLIYHATGYFVSGRTAERFGNGHPSIVPYDTFEASDGPLMLAVGNDDQWRRFCTAAGLDALAGDPRFATNPRRVEHRAALQPILERALRARTRAEWTTALAQAGVPCGAVRSVDEALADAQLDARAMIATVHHPSAGAVRLVDTPIKLSGPAARRPPGPPPTLGQHTETVLGELGVAADTIRDLRTRDVI
jgi:crotonobetainyl-CoA:carnitine CoA-transferase CaiB-like acyl-CoA transferase